MHEIRTSLCVAQWLRAWDLVSGWAVGAGEDASLLSSPLHPFLAWDLALQPPLPCQLECSSRLTNGGTAQEVTQPMGFNILLAQVLLHIDEAGEK